MKHHPWERMSHFRSIIRRNNEVVAEQWGSRSSQLNTNCFSVEADLILSPIFLKRGERHGG